MTPREESQGPDHHYESEEANLYHEGIALFNEGDWFEAHEVWEDIWHMASGPRKAFYQGLIQCAVTLEHLKRGNPRGVRSVYQSARTKFTGLPSVYMGIDIPALLAAMDGVVNPILQLPAKAFEPGAPHGQDLPVEAAKLPWIKLEHDPFEAERIG